jgi:transcriptional regulator with XRE-family HTH domain
MNEKQLLLDLAKRLKALRKIKGVTQEDVYNDTGIHIARIEQGKRDVAYTTLVRLAEYFGVGLGEFHNKPSSAKEK